MDHIAAAEEQIVTERLRRKLEEVNVSAQSQLSPIQDHINFTLQVYSSSPSLGTNCEKNSPESEEKRLLLVNNSSVLVKFSCGLSLVGKNRFQFHIKI